MAYTTAEGRQTVLGDLATAVRQLGEALRWLTEAYEHLDEDTADRLEGTLFRATKAAFGTAKRTYGDFATRHGIVAAGLEESTAPGRPLDPHSALERAMQSVTEAEETVAALQDSMLPVEVGDQELRRGLSQVRELIGPLPVAASDLLRTLGR